ncbi:Ubiquitin-fold modifier-conjugating enzyme 1 [Galdieria sulphuraria]|nr:Ubiquitin-fold modifier-conjugating enzyme 1 [Galdieria sulphuraria]
MDDQTKNTVQKLPFLSVRAGPRDKDKWNERLQEELSALIHYVQFNKEQDNDWFYIDCDETGILWNGKCWYYLENVRYEFELTFEIPVSYPTTPPELVLPELEGKTAKMYRGGKICQTVHFQPLWSRNVPRFGIAHCLALSLGPWLAAEVPEMFQTQRHVNLSLLLRRECMLEKDYLLQHIVLYKIVLDLYSNRKWLFIDIKLHVERIDMGFIGFLSESLYKSVHAFSLSLFEDI